MKFNIAYPKTGAQKMFNIDDEHKWGKLVDKRLGQEFDGDVLGDEFKGYIFKITGGSDNDGFAMKQGILIKGRVRLILEPEASGFICHKDGARRRKGVRGCIVGTDISCLHCIIVKKGDSELEGLTDVSIPRRLGPKRANKIRRLFGLPKHSDNLAKKGQAKVEVDKFDVNRYVVKRPTKEAGDKKYYKAPKIQRLVTAERIRRKRLYRQGRVDRAKVSQKAYSEYLKQLKDMKEQTRAKRANSLWRTGQDEW